MNTLKIQLIRASFFLCLFAALVTHSHAQCGLALRDLTVSKIGDATYLKDFRVRFEEDGNPKKPPQEEYTILLNKGTHYRFNIKADSTNLDNPVLKLYDFSKPYGSTFLDGDHYESFDFFCAKTQVYYLSISFAEAKKGCITVVVSYVNNYDAN